MRLVIQRVKYALVTVDNDIIGSINAGLLVLVGIKKGDNIKDISYCIDKMVNLRIFKDENDKMNLSVKDINGEILIISQFTLYGDTSHGRRPSFIDAEEPSSANELYENFIAKSEEAGLKIEKGIFGADMKVELLNDGPVTIIIESPRSIEGEN